MNQKYTTIDCLKVFHIKGRKTQEEWYIVATDKDEAIDLLYTRGGEKDLANYDVITILGDNEFVEAIIGTLK